MPICFATPKLYFATPSGVATHSLRSPDSEHCNAFDFCFNIRVYRSGMHLVLSKARRPVDKGEPGPPLFSVLAN